MTPRLLILSLLLSSTWSFVLKNRNEDVEDEATAKLEEVTRAEADVEKAMSDYLRTCYSTGYYSNNGYGYNNGYGNGYGNAGYGGNAALVIPVNYGNGGYGNGGYGNGVYNYGNGGYNYGNGGYGNGGYYPGAYGRSLVNTG